LIIEGDSAEISFVLLIEWLDKLRIYDLTGKEVVVFVKETKQAVTILMLLVLEAGFIFLFTNYECHKLNKTF